MFYCDKKPEGARVHLEGDNGDVDIYVDGIAVAFFDGDTRTFTAFCLSDEDQRDLDLQFEDDHIKIVSF